VRLQAIKAASQETQRLARALCDGKVLMVFDCLIIIKHIYIYIFFVFPKQFTVGVLNATLDLAASVLVGVVAFLGSEMVLSPVVSLCLPGWGVVGVATFFGFDQLFINFFQLLILLFINILSTFNFIRVHLQDFCGPGLQCQLQIFMVLQHHQDLQLALQKFARQN